MFENIRFLRRSMPGSPGTERISVQMRRNGHFSNVGERAVGGGSGIRTHDTVSRIHAFQASAFSHSATPPGEAQYSGGASSYNPRKRRWNKVLRARMAPCAWAPSA